MEIIVNIVNAIYPFAMIYGTGVLFNLLMLNYTLRSTHARDDEEGREQLESAVLYMSLLSWLTVGAVLIALIKNLKDK